MNILAVDDEKYALSSLCEAISGCRGQEDIHSFSTCGAAIEYAEKNGFDVAFLDINMRGMGGIELAKKLREINPKCRIVFCTAHPDYALEAFGVHADGYLIKPITAEAVSKELDRFESYKEPDTERKLLEIRCFGGFEVLGGGKPLAFKRSKTKELFALLVDRRGDTMTAREICAELFDDDGYGDEKNMAYLWNLLSDLKKTLAGVGAADVLRHSGTGYSVDRSLVDCDYFRYLDEEKELFRGEYMSRYSWAENTLAALLDEN